jgi:hypothetical protein
MVGISIPGLHARNSRRNRNRGAIYFGYHDSLAGKGCSGVTTYVRSSICGFRWGRPSAWCAQYDLYSGGESPLWTVMTGTIRLGKGARREAGSEESQRRNRGFDVQEADRRPLQPGSPSQVWGSPMVIRTLWGRSDESTRRRQALPEEISVLVRSHRTTGAAMPRDRGGEVSRSPSSLTRRRAESLVQGAVWRFR